jgi:hypothetical protein
MACIAVEKRLGCTVQNGKLFAQPPPTAPPWPAAPLVGCAWPDVLALLHWEPDRRLVRTSGDFRDCKPDTVP